MPQAEMSLVTKVLLLAMLL